MCVSAKYINFVMWQCRLYSYNYVACVCTQFSVPLHVQLCTCQATLQTPGASLYRLLPV